MKSRRPSRQGVLPYGRQWIQEEEIQTAVQVLRGDWITQGPLIERFEDAIARYCGVPYAVAVSSGTAALHAACAAAGIGPGDEVIIPTLTFVASANCVAFCGGRPVLADIDPQTLTLDLKDAERRITSRTKAIVSVDFAGLPAEMEELRALAEKHHLCLISDSAHSLGAEYRGHRVGGLADMTILSFHPVKHITTGEGGMVLTSDAALASRLRAFRTHGIVRQPEELTANDGPWYYEMQHLGYNYRITDFQCALGLAQLDRLDSFLSRRREIAALYGEAFRANAALILPPAPLHSLSAHHIYPLQFRTELLTATRRTLFEDLRAAGIGVQVHYIPIHFQPYYQRTFGYERGQFPAAEHYYERTLTIPLFPAMSDEDAMDVINAVEDLVDRYLVH